MLDPSTGVFEIVNFPPGRRVKAVVRPDNGASITIIRKPARVLSMKTWIEERSRSSGQDAREDTATKTRRGEDRKVTEIESHWTDAGVTERDVDAYFNAGEGLFRATLTYWSGDPDATRYRKILLDVVATVALAK